YYRGGDEAVLPCNRPSSLDSCSAVDWFHKRNESIKIQQEVQRGIVQSSPRSARLSLDRNCSLIINNINAEDAGWYRCICNFSTEQQILVFFSVSSSPPDIDPIKNGNITLLCSLVRSRGFGSCPDKSLLWVNETGSELTGEGDGYKSGGQFGCVSLLTVNLQSSRRFTCQFVEGNEVKIEAHYGSEGMMSSHLKLSYNGDDLHSSYFNHFILFFTAGRKKPQKDINVRETIMKNTFIDLLYVDYK
uniref:Ig-like domain-containing protein n=1 Tax=Xiphophorus maculatus TaxID=8083 RepID=M4ANI7_XIPMA